MLFCFAAYISLHELDIRHRIIVYLSNATRNHNESCFDVSCRHLRVALYIRKVHSVRFIAVDESTTYIFIFLFSWFDCLMNCCYLYLRFAHLDATGKVKNLPCGSALFLPLFLISLMAGFGSARQTMMQQHAVSVKSVSFI